MARRPSRLPEHEPRGGMLVAAPTPRVGVVVACNHPAAVKVARRGRAQLSNTTLDGSRARRRPPPPGERTFPR